MTDEKSPTEHPDETLTRSLRGDLHHSWVMRYGGLVAAALEFVMATWYASEGRWIQAVLWAAVGASMLAMHANRAQHVSIDRHGLRVRRPWSTRSWRWDEIESVRVIRSQWPGSITIVTPQSGTTTNIGRGSGDFELAVLKATTDQIIEWAGAGCDEVSDRR